MDNEIKILGLTIENWLTIGLIIVGSFALFIYWLQERKKISEAASLIILQIEEFQERVREISTFIENGKLNDINFYESLPLMNENYWDKYKHYFVQKMDANSFTSLNLFYQYIAEIQEQQLLTKNLQKNTFFHTQNLIATIETQLIFNGLNSTINNMHSNLPANNLIYQPIPPNFNFNLTQFTNTFVSQQNNLQDIINQNILLTYIPKQICTSLEKIFKKYSMLEITGSDGYRLLKKYSKR